MAYVTFLLNCASCALCFIDMVYNCNWISCLIDDGVWESLPELLAE